MSIQTSIPETKKFPPSEMSDEFLALLELPKTRSNRLQNLKLMQIAMERQSRAFERNEPCKGEFTGCALLFFAGELDRIVGEMKFEEEMRIAVAGAGRNRLLKPTKWQRFFTIIGLGDEA